MEQIEVHSRSYLLRWVFAKPGYTISWTIQPQKRSVNFGLFKHPGGLTNLPTVAGLPALSLGTDKPEDEDVPEVVDKLASIGLKQVVRLGKYEADKFNQGRYDVPYSEGGHYALVFDNTFSKSTSKNVIFFLLSYPTNCQSQIGFGAQVHHGQAMASAMSMAAPVSRSKSPSFGAKERSSRDSLRSTNASSATLIPPVATPGGTPQDPNVHAGVLSKRRRKKHQGYARRYFSLDFTSSTLSYYHDRNSSALRGAIPLSLAAIGANAKTREISIDSGAEIWHLRAGSTTAFEAWKAALEKASRNVVENMAQPSLELDTGTNVLESVNVAQHERLENLLSKLSGTRDAVRRLCQDTAPPPGIPSPRLSQTPNLDGVSSPVEREGESYFGAAAERPKFWKRKASGTESQRSIFKRGVSSQLAVPTSTSTQTSTSREASQHERSINDHMKAVLNTLDLVVSEFSVLIKQVRRQSSLPQAATSRLSLHSVDSQEYFDAEPGRLSRADTQLLDIAADEEETAQNDSASDSGSDVDDTITTRGQRSTSQSSTLPPKSRILTPLPLSPITRRTTIKSPTVLPPSLISFLRKNVGKDLSTISMPVSANEPTSLLQKAAENLEYSDLLDKAATLSSPTDRLLHVSAFVLSSLSANRQKERNLRKPFNPMLGETYELVREDKSLRFLAEKVSHRPVQLAFHAEGLYWTFSQSPKPSQKFWGKSSEIITEGKARIVLYPHTPGTFGGGSTDTPEIYSFVSPTCFLRNIIAGEKYVEPVGSMTILNDTTGHKAVVTFKAGGMFSGRSEDLDVDIFESDGSPTQAGLAGKWTDRLVSKDTGHEIWRVGELVDQPAKHYGMTLFAAGLNEITAIERDRIPVTDSRLRADQRALEDGKYDEAEKLKNEIEEGQRRRRKEMEQEGKEWTPMFFAKVESGGDTGAEVTWRLKTGKDKENGEGGGYWDRRARNDWKGIIDVLSPG